jgi:hypothetical protein
VSFAGPLGYCSFQCTVVQSHCNSKFGHESQAAHDA